MSRFIKMFLSILIFVITGSVPVVRGDIPRMINFQGRLTDGSGQALDTAVGMIFSLYRDSSDIIPMWSDTETSIVVQDGLFNVMLGRYGPLIPDSVFNSPNLWLGIKVGDDPDEINTRTRISSVGYAFRVSTVDGASGGTIYGDVSIQSDLSVSGKATIGPGHTNTGAFGFTAGENNNVLGDYSTVGGGTGNSAGFGPAMQGRSTVSGGENNQANVDMGTIGGGHNNVLSASVTTISGGENNSATYAYASVGGGINNTACAYSSTIAGGQDNTADGVMTTIGGGRQNQLTGDAEYSTISGGRENWVNDEDYVTIGGGGNNVSTGENSTISGGRNNTVTSYGATVGGGVGNTARQLAAVGGGWHNYAGSAGASVGGGGNNYARGAFSVIAGGGDTLAADSNAANGMYSVIGGGKHNIADSNYSSIGGGYFNSTGGEYGTVPGGRYNHAGRYAFAAGQNAKANHDGAVVIAANSSSNAGDSVRSGGEGQVVFRADGGIYITNTGEQAPYNIARLINTSTGAHLTIGGVWTNGSDRNLKENFTPVDGREMLDKIARLPVSRWNYKSEDDHITHIGPVSQDFNRLFEVGNDELSVSTIDPSGVALVGIKELIVENKRLQQRIEKLESLVARLVEKDKK